MCTDCSLGPSESHSQMGSPCPAAHLWMQVGEKGSNLKEPLTGPVTIKGGLIVGSVDPHVQQVSAAVPSSHLCSQLRSHWALTNGGAIVGVVSCDPHGSQHHGRSAVLVWHSSSQLKSHCVLTNGGAIVGCGVVLLDPHVQQVPSVVSSLHLWSQFMSHWPLTIGGAIVGWGVTLHSQVVPSVVWSLHLCSQSMPTIGLNFCGRTTRLLSLKNKSGRIGLPSVQCTNKKATSKIFIVTIIFNVLWRLLKSNWLRKIDSGPLQACYASSRTRQYQVIYLWCRLMQRLLLCIR